MIDMVELLRPDMDEWPYLCAPSDSLEFLIDISADNYLHLLKFMRLAQRFSVLKLQSDVAAFSSSPHSVYVYQYC